MDKPVVIKTLNDVVMKDIKVKRPFTYTLPSKMSQTVFRISHAGQPLLFQTPVVVIPYSYSLYDNERFSLDVILFKDDPVFSRLMDSIADYILQKIKKKCPVPSVLVEPCIFRSRMRFRTNNIDSIMTFDINNRPLDTRCIQTHDRMMCLFSISRFVVGDSKCYFQLELHQMKRLESLTCIIPRDTCLISSPECTAPVPSSLEKYKKMLRFGIPIEAIKQKMSLDGLSKVDITNFASSLSTSAVTAVAVVKLSTLPTQPSPSMHPAPAPPPPPPPLPPNLPMKLQVQPRPQWPQRPQPPKPKVTPETQPQPPSLSDILSMKGRLRKVPKSLD
jgi:hypothetical protein